MENYEDVVLPLPSQFHELAKRLKVSADDLAFSILIYFSDHPDEFCLVSHDPNDARRDTQPLSL
jgi:hypothetical protein